MIEFEVYTFENKEKIIIGRSANGSMPDIDIPKNPMISSEHAVITWNRDKKAYFLKNTSINGIRYDGEAVMKFEPNVKLQTEGLLQISQRVKHVVYELIINTHEDDHCIAFHEIYKL